VFTYGPLGYLTFFYFSPRAAGTRLVADVVLCFTVAAGLCLVAWRERPAWGCALVGVFVFMAANLETRTDLVVDSGLLCWGLLCMVESGRRLTFSVLVFAALAAFGALAKTSVLFMVAPSVVLLAGGLVARGQPRLGVGMVAIFGAGIVLGWMAAGQNLSHLGTYLTNALAVVQGYNQALAWEALPQASASGFVLIALVLGMVIIRGLTAFEQGEQHIAWRRGLVVAWVGCLLLPIWKHGFVRGDAYHLVYFFGFAPVLALALEVLPCENRAARLWARGLGAACCLVAIFTVQSLFFGPGWKSLAQPVRAFSYHARCLLYAGEYQRRMNDYIETNRRRTRLPEFRKVIGRASVDVFGQQQLYALLNDLNYRPRPVFQSYVACTARLMSLNEQFYLSPEAPEYVIFALGPTDRRFPPLEDAMVLRDLLLNFEPAGAESNCLLLKRKSLGSPRLKLLREGTVRPGEQINLKDFSGADLWLEISLEPTLPGRLRQFFYRPPTVRLAAWGESAKRPLLQRRAPAPMLAAGFVASPLLQRNEDMLARYSGNPASRPSGYSVELLPGEEHFWQSAARFRVFEILAAEGLRAPR
jgi:hypothetical protein